MFLLVTLACTPPGGGSVEVPDLPESDGGTLSGAWPEADVRVDAGTLVVGERTVARGVRVPPAVGSGIVAWADGERIGALRGDEQRILAEHVNADRLGLSDDGDTLAFVASNRGFASVWVVPTDGSSPARPLTNNDVVPSKSGPPGGWVPPPRNGAPRFEGDVLRWEGAQGPEEVRWR